MLRPVSPAAHGNGCPYGLQNDVMLKMPVFESFSSKRDGKFITTDCLQQCPKHIPGLPVTAACQWRWGGINGLAASVNASDALNLAAGSDINTVSGNTVGNILGCTKMPRWLRTSDGVLLALRRNTCAQKQKPALWAGSLE